MTAQIRLVAANFFPAFHPPSSGGEQRYFHLYQALSEKFDVTLISTTYPDREEEVIEHSPTFREHRVPKSPFADPIHWELEKRGIGPECSGYAVALAGAFDGEFGERFRALAATADVVIHESPFTVPYDHHLGRDGIPRIYNSYNVEADLARQMLRGDAGAEAADFIEDLERHLLEHSAIVFATSADDRDTFVHRYGVDACKIYLAPNGFDEAAVPPVPSERVQNSSSVVFLGSNHPPNVEALDFIATRLAPASPLLKFDIIGSVCKAYSGEVPENVNLRGFVTAEEKTELLNTCAAAINPLFSGAGTNLKMLDYMAHGVPIVTTSIGARGLELVDGQDVVIAEPDRFALALAAITRDSAKSKAIGARASALARQRYSWRSIGCAVAEVLEAQFCRQVAAQGRRRLLSVCDYPVDSAAGGGQVRVLQLLTELGREFDVTLLCLTDDAAVTERILAPNVVQRAIPKTVAHRAEQSATCEGEWISIADVVSGRHCLRNAGLTDAFKAELQQVDLVLFEQCFLSPLLTLVPEGVPLMYSSQNHEAELKQALLSQRRDGDATLAEVDSFERVLVERASLTICVSQGDADSFKARYPGVATLVVENGVRIPERCAQRHTEEFPFGLPLAVFLGSGHPPNVQAVRFIIEKLASATPDVLYGIVGSVCDSFQMEALPENILLLGFLSDSEKDALLQLADLAVNPLFEGGGSSLKVPDFFAAGLPTVSSAVGVRGYPVQNGIHYFQADPSHFARAVEQLVRDPALRARVGNGARRLVQLVFYWRILGGKLRHAVRAYLPARQGLPRLLALTYRLSEPPRGGAEMFLSKVLEQIQSKGEWEIVVAATSVGAIQNHLMFSAIYESPPPADRIPDWVRDVRLFPVDDPVVSLQEDCRRLHALWMEESRLLGRRFLDTFPDAALTGGWHHPEKGTGGRVARWSSVCSQLRLPPDASGLRISLYAPQPVTVELIQDATVLGKHDVEGAAIVDFDLPRGGLLALRCSKTYRAPGDPRELGVLVDSIRIDPHAGDIEVDFEHELDLLPRRLPLATWVSALVEIAEVRSPNDDDLFLKVRGPHSAQLSEWLDTELVNFDAVLVQGVPFVTSALGIEAARRAGVPAVLLPHAHIEDRYYHWQSFYDAYRGADRVIAAPDVSVPAFFDRVGARATALPGGGVDLREFDPPSLERGRKAFRSVHESARPYVLILGRKADGKNYQVVVDAHQRLRADGVDLDLVMIGPDDDGLPLGAEGVRYLGKQPREVVLGALADAACLATMSESESFGIVLLEAWLAGTPVIASRRCAAFSELVQDQIDGRLVADPAELEEAIRDYVVDQTSARLHARRGAQKARCYAWGEIAQQIDELLSSVSHSSSGRINQKSSDTKYRDRSGIA